MGTNSDVDMIMLMLMMIPAYINKTTASSIELRRTFGDSVETLYSSLKRVTDNRDCVFEDVVLRVIDSICFSLGAGSSSVVWRVFKQRRRVSAIIITVKASTVFHATGTSEFPGSRSSTALQGVQRITSGFII